ncbi:MAG: iron-sulfur cluster repair di-iron protein [Saprospiraceae bacterium]|nr:iron-sulfur cluster repair di-iron protein [Pyrinomonadaceae bacterium]
MQTFTTKTIRDIALESPQTTRVFEEFKIDYCCGGRKLLNEVCLEAGLDFALIAKKLESVMNDNSRSGDSGLPEKKSPSQLIDYIIGKHHLFTAQEVERLTPLMEKVCQRHGEQHPELFKLQTIFLALADSLIPHMRKEETVLFPFIQQLELSSTGEVSLPASHFGTVENPIRMMMSDHEEDGERLRVMREISNDYVLPDGACPSYTALYAGLQDLEKDLHRHIHLENNVLFPAATQLERDVFALVR